MVPSQRPSRDTSRASTASPSVSSVSPEFDTGNRAVIDLLAGWLDDLGFAVRVDPLIEDYVLTLLEGTRRGGKFALGLSTRAGVGLVRAAQARGFETMEGLVLRENHDMLRFVRAHERFRALPVVVLTTRGDMMYRDATEATRLPIGAVGLEADLLVVQGPRMHVGGVILGALLLRAVRNPALAIAVGLVQGVRSPQVTSYDVALAGLRPRPAAGRPASCSGT